MNAFTPSTFDLFLPYLEHYPDPGGAPQRVILDRFPFRLGRDETADCTLYSRRVSKEHAVIVRIEDEFRICDLGSTNGTFVNGKRIEEAMLSQGDIVHIANKEFRFGYDSPVPKISFDPATEHTSLFPNCSLIQANEQLQDLLGRNCLRTVFHPILNLLTQEILGYEALVRGTHDQLTSSPAPLFRLAEQCRLASALSRSARQAALVDGLLLPNDAMVFINLHPAEVADKSLLQSLAHLPPSFCSNSRLVLEIHEDVVVDTPTMRRLHEQLRELGIALAYDDFGAGQARLNALVDVPPDFIKLDMSLIRNLHESKARQDLVETLGRISADLGCKLIAEGIETQEEAETCLRLGCTFGQGYLYGRPEPVSSFLANV